MVNLLRGRRGIVVVFAVFLLVKAGTSLYHEHNRAGIEARLRDVLRATHVHRSLASTPPMGFNDWNAFHCTVTESEIEGIAAAMATRGLLAAGYRAVNLDDCWSALSRDAHGRLQANQQRFPHGIFALARFIHSLGFTFGIYADAGTQTCAGYPGSYGHEAQDAATFAAWGVDYVKVDWCHVPYATFADYTPDDVAQTLYARTLHALQATHRPMLLSVSNAGDPAIHPWLWGAAVANLWRTTPDIADSWASVLSIVDANVRYAAYGGPGRWNDADMLEVGNGGMTPAEYRAHFSLWSMMAAPLLLGTDVRTMPPWAVSIVSNRAVIAVDQDPLGMGAVVTFHQGNGEIFVRPLAHGDRAVLFLNRGAPSITLRASARTMHLVAKGSYTVRDLWQGTTRTGSGTITVTVPPNSAVMVRVSGE